MAQGKFLCFKDTNGLRGIVSPNTPYTIKQISDTSFWLESKEISTLISLDPLNAECDNYGAYLGYVNDEEKALNWVLCDDNDAFIGLDTE